jgi:hypothetical protein
MNFLIPILIKIIMWCILMLVGTWYLYSSINGQAFAYVSINQFLSSIGACQGGQCDISTVKGCFLCPFVEKIFNIIGHAAGALWDSIMTTTWILLVIGLIIFIFYSAYKTIKESSDENIKLDTSDRKFDFKKWFEGIKSQLIRVMAAGAVLGVFGLGGHETLQQVSNVIVYPVMSIGTSIAGSMTDVAGDAVCEPKNIEETPMAGVTKSFVCVIANLNVAILKGASLGFAISDGVFAGMGGGFFIWLSGFGIVLMFMYLGFNILFQVMNVMVLTALVTYSMSSLDYDQNVTMEVGQKCENMAKLSDGTLNKETYASCFRSERALNPKAFGFLDRGWDVLITMVFMFIAYKLLIEERIAKFITSSSDEGAYFRFGDTVKGIASAGWNALKWLTGKIPGLK